MAEAPQPASQPQVVILSSTEDNVLQPDAMRGSEHFLAGLRVRDMEEERRKKAS